MKAPSLAFLILAVSLTIPLAGCMSDGQFHIKHDVEHTIVINPKNQQQQQQQRPLKKIFAARRALRGE